MKSSLLIVGLIGIVLGGGGAVYYWMNYDPSMSDALDAKENPEGVKQYDPANSRNKLMESLEEQNAWQNYWNQFAPKTGQPAVDFELKDIEGKETFRLSDYKGKKPVALIFGSFT